MVKSHENFWGLPELEYAVLVKVNPFYFFSWKLALSPIKLPVFYFRAFDFIPHTFMFDCYEDFWGLPELEYSGLVKVIFLTCLTAGNFP